MPIPITALLGIITTAKALVDAYENQSKKHDDELEPIDQVDMVDAREKMKELKVMLNNINLEEE